jgi:metal-responsive CopG/Arc/MetJ family transcriptional regulator
VRLPAALLAEIDRLARTRYVNRSDAIRDAIRTLLREQDSDDHACWPPPGGSGNEEAAA